MLVLLSERNEAYRYHVLMNVTSVTSNDVLYWGLPILTHYPIAAIGFSSVRERPGCSSMSERGRRYVVHEDSPTPAQSTT